MTDSEGVLKVFWTVFCYLNYPEAPTVEWAFEPFLKWTGVASATRNTPFKTASQIAFLGSRRCRSLRRRHAACADDYLWGGHAEGTRDVECNPTAAFWGHIEPGNGVWNQGTFSYQHGAASPEQADEQQLAYLQGPVRETLQRQALEKFGVGLSESALLNGIDLWNQAPQAGQDYVGHLPSSDPTEAEIVQARVQSFVAPATGQLDAPGLGDSWTRVEADQRRRMEKTQTASRILRSQPAGIQTE